MAADKIHVLDRHASDDGRPPRAGGGTHVAFRAANRKAGDEFHRAALANGAKDDGKARPAADLSSELLRAFVIDQDGPADRRMLYTGQRDGGRRLILIIKRRNRWH